MTARVKQRVVYDLAAGVIFKVYERVNRDLRIGNCRQTTKRCRNEYASNKTIHSYKRYALPACDRDWEVSGSAKEIPRRLDRSKGELPLQIVEAATMCEIPMISAPVL